MPEATAQKPPKPGMKAEAPGKGTVSEEPPLDVGFVIENSLHRLAKLGFLAFILAWVLSMTSSGLWFNLPLAVLLIMGALWLSTHFDIQPASSRKQRRGLSIDHHEGVGGGSKVPPPPPFAPGAGIGHKPDSHWREQVASAVVESAWEALCGSIIQEFLYDMWYSTLTPDREFPKEIRRVLNTAFGELAGRARTCDLKGMLLRDVSELVMDQIELYRDTKESIMRGMEAEAWLNMAPAARERALVAELKAENNLHPALYPPDDSTAILGHYKVLRQISEGVIAFVMERSDHAKTIMRSVARELLTTCVFRALMGYFTPYNANKLLLFLLQKRVERKPMDVEEVAAAAEAASVRPAARGNWDFQERVRQSIQQEETASRPGKPAQTRRSKPQVVQSARPLSNSMMQEATQEAAPPGIKRVKSENSLSAHTDSDGWEDLLASAPRASVKPSVALHSRGPSIETAPRVRPGHSRSSSTASEVGNATLVAAAVEREAEHWRTRGGFVGKPQARVVAAELNSEGSKDVVIYKIRVADGTGEWTVSRRFRNFEALHRTLREVPSYRLKMPAKRVFTHSQTTDFVEERRQQLDAYLQQILLDSSLASRQEVWEFLSAWSEVYGLDCNNGIFSSINASLRDANVNMRRAVGDMVDELDSKRRKALPALTKMAPGLSSTRALDTQLEEASTRPNPVLGGAQSVKGLPSQRSNDNLAQNAKQRTFAKGNPSHLLSGSQVLQPFAIQKLMTGELISNALFPKPKEEQSPNVSTPGLARSSAEELPPVEEFRGQLLHYSYTPPAEGRGAAASQRSSPANEQATPSNRSSLLDSSSPGDTPAAQEATVQRVRSVSDPLSQARREPSPARREGSQKGSPKASRLRQDSAVSPDPPREDAEAASTSCRAADEDSGHIKLGARPSSLSPLGSTIALEAVPPSVAQSSVSAAAAKVMDEKGGVAAVALEEAAGISAPLYDIVDILFELQSRGFFRRQVYGVARQMLSLVAGGAIDEYLLSQLRALRQEHSLARLIHSLQAFLWPGGTWFQRLPQRQQQQKSEEPQPRFVMTPENFLAQNGPRPLDEDEIQEAVRELLVSSAPPALIRIIGRVAYDAGMRDLFDMMQSLIFMQQLGYGLLKIFLLNLLPELRPLFRAIERGPFESGAGSKTARK